ncbi:hypothetical protein [Mesorhizobium sp. CA16]|uniref:hypothetical protein n=1 Tax=Mesorhizobium sp. CA16 TaxID=588496 RepID=UPI001CCC00E2|nr:hypothetical protein [Mesorhizobium sp. CA16]MBZ9911391.1 hypothetical protein [Mesorhizobium sp. CA16]
MIVFLSSSARARYADDVIRMLALPRGGQLQFRYDGRWLADDVRNRVPCEQLADEYALVCFVAGSSDPIPYDLIPVRIARIIRAETVGTSYIFTLAAHAYVSEATAGALNTAISPLSRERLPSAAHAPNELYCFSVDLDLRSHQRLTFDAFEETAKQLSRHKSFATEESAFFAVRQISRISGRSWFGTWPRPSAVEQGAFRLRTGRRYECEVYCLRLFQHPADAVDVQPTHKELALVVEANDDSIQFASAKRSVVDSRYDVKRYVFAAEPEVMRRVSGFRLFLSAEGDGGNQVRQDITLQIMFGGSLFLASIRAIAIGIATAGPGMIAANAAGKLNSGTAVLMIALGALAGISAIFPSFRKP